MVKSQVAVLRGGPSHLYDLSLKTGGAVLQHMPEKYQAHDIYISPDGTWHRDGIARNPERSLSNIDVVFNALHGHYGEDGKVQKILDSFSIPYTGSTAIPSALSMNKIMTRKVLEEHNIKTPYYASIKNTDNIPEKVHFVFHHFFLPLIVKPASSGWSLGVTLVKEFDQLETALEAAFEYSDTVIVEEYVRGKEASSGVVEDFRHLPLYTLFPIEIKYPPEYEYFSHVVKRNDITEETIPGTFTDDEKEELQYLAKRIHEILKLRHYSQTDFIVTPHRGIYVLEVNNQPDLSDNSLMKKSLEAVGSNFPTFLDHILHQALHQKAYNNINT